MPDSTLNPMWTDPSGKDFTRATKVGTLPIRGEKRLVPFEIERSAFNKFNGPVTDAHPPTSPAYEAISYAKQTFTDYITVTIPSRKDSVGQPYTFRFLINPKTLTVGRQTSDALTMARGGWQFGVWGEDTIDLHFSGITAGQYFEYGLTDRWEQFSISYRNATELANLFENNGYYFEGEEANSKWSAPDYTRKRIKCQEDVILKVGNFSWSGMFTSMTLNHTADTPYFNTFELGFLAWKERFAAKSPWDNKDAYNNVYRGHSMEIIKENLAQIQKAKDNADKRNSEAETDFSGGVDKSKLLLVDPSRASLLGSGTTPKFDFSGGRGK